MSTAPMFDELPQWLDREAWKDFVEMRKAKGSRAPFTPGAQKRMLAKLTVMHQAGIDTAAALGQSVIAGWSDVFEPRPPARAPLQTAHRPSSFSQEKQQTGAAWMGRHAEPRERSADSDTVDME